MEPDLKTVSGVVVSSQVSVSPMPAATLHSRSLGRR